MDSYCFSVMAWYTSEHTLSGEQMPSDQDIKQDKGPGTSG